MCIPGASCTSRHPRRSAQKGSACEERAATARDGGLGRGPEATLAEIVLRRVWFARHVVGEDDPGALLHGGQGSAVDDRAGARRAGQTARSDVLLHVSGLEGAKILSTYAGRWSIEVTFENCKQLLGMEDPANRTEKAVRRTAPMALVLYSLIVAWFHQVGHRYLRFPDRPWYPQKKEPSFADMLTTLRRQSWNEHFSRSASQKRTREKNSCPDYRISLSCRVTPGWLRTALVKSFLWPAKIVTPVQRCARLRLGYEQTS